MEIKYEAVFGPQELFNETMPDVICVSKNNETGELFQYASIVIALRDLVRYQGDSDFTVAMRRIIRTPIWTVEDQKAGKLPEVGAKLIYTETWDAFEFVGVIAGSMRWACKDFQDGFLYFFEQSEMSPIETPEEKAARLREEWCRKCTSQFYPRGSKGFPEMIYDALLSGDLPVPVKE